jgi:hypothetical protein
LQARGIVGLPEYQVGDAEALGRRKFALGLGPSAEFDRASRATASREVRQRRQRCAGTTEMLEERPERAWPDMFTRINRNQSRRCSSVRCMPA